MSPGYQSVQPSHALAQFAVEHHDIFIDWQRNHKNLIVLVTDSEDTLTDLWIKARSLGISVSGFLEPDVGNQLTAIALEPSPLTYKLTGNLPLALKDPIKEFVT